MLNRSVLRLPRPLGLLLMAACFRSAPSIPKGHERTPQPLEGQFQRELDALHDEYSFPGATAAYILADGTVGVAATGLSDVEARTPMKAESRMLAASIGKSFVAATVLALAQEGRLRLDDPISRWLGDRPWFPRLPNHTTITLRHLLTHSAGLPDHAHMEEFTKVYASRWRDPGNPFPPETLVAFLLDKPALFKPGEGWAYTDTGYILIGLIIEQVATHTYYEEVRQRFLSPLGLGMTVPSDRLVLPSLAAGYAAADNWLGMPAKATVSPGTLAWNPAMEWTGGGLLSNPRDLVVWAKALYEGRAMKGDYLNDLLRSVPVDGGQSGIRYGAGVGIYEKGPLGPTYGHGGLIPGYSSSMRYYPKYRVAVAFQINTDVGIADHSTPLLTEMERRLAAVVTTASQK